MRFEDGLPIRDIAERWQCDPAWLHHEFARARRDFKRALGQALGLDQDIAPETLEREVRRLWDVLR
jgi:RNA polymerase sigma-70 factor (ECF subfamily)